MLGSVEATRRQTRRGVAEQKQLQALIRGADLQCEPIECICMDLEDIAVESELEPYAEV